MLNRPKKLSLSLVLLATTIMSLAPLVGCSTKSKRINMSGAEFTKLTPEQQMQVQNGNVENGYTQSMVYFSEGDPDTVEVLSPKSPRREIWIYKKPRLSTVDNHTKDTGFYGAYSAPQPGGSPQSPTPMFYRSAALVVELTDGVVTQVSRR